MTDEAISPLRRRMIEDMTVRNFAAGFLPWRFPYAGPGARGTVRSGRHPKPFTGAAMFGTLLHSMIYPRWARDASLRAPRNSLPLFHAEMAARASGTCSVLPG